MGLVFCIISRHIQRIISKLCYPLETVRAECTAHRGMYITIYDIRRIIFIHRFGFMGKAFFICKWNIIMRYVGKKITFSFLPRYQSDRIPLVRCSLHIGPKICRYMVHIVTHIVKNRLLGPCFFHRGQHFADIMFGGTYCSRMARFVVNFKAHHIGIILIGKTGMWVYVPQEPSYIPLLCRYGLWVGMYLTFVV